MIKAQSLKKSAILSVVLATAGKLMSLATTLIVAYLFGANNQTDLIFFLYSLTVLFSGFWTHFNSNVLLPSLVEEFKHNPILAWQKCCSIATTMLASMLILLPLICLFYNEILSFISRWDTVTIESSYSFFLVLIVLLPVIYLNDLFCIVYQSQKHFTFTYLNSLCYGFMCLSSIFLFSSNLGPYSLAIGMTSAGVLQLIIMLRLLFKAGLKFKLIFQSLDFVKINWKPWLASLALFGTQFLLIFLPDYFATGLQQGSFTSILNGRKVVEIMTTLVMFPVILIFYPRMVEWHKSADSGYKLQLVVKFLIWLSTPLICLMTLLGPQLIEYFFHNGSYTEAHTLISKISLLTLTPGIFFISLFSLTTRWILAQKSSSILIQFCLMLALSTLISLPIFDLMTTQFQEQGLLWSQLGFQVICYGLLSLLFLNRTNGFSCLAFTKDLLLSILVYSPIMIISYLADSISIGILTAFLIIILGFIFKVSEVKQWLIQED